jgi:hypothetical protein
MTAILVVPWARENHVGGLISCGRIHIPIMRVRDLGLVYLLSPLSTLAGTDLFNDPEIQIVYFSTREAAVRWATEDIAHRRQLRMVQARLRAVSARLVVLKDAGP